VNEKDKQIILEQFKDYIVEFKGGSVIIEKRKDGKLLDVNDLLIKTMMCEVNYERT
jgi:hypothetical protein